jgi:putative MATE family efflux protein
MGGVSKVSNRRIAAIAVPALGSLVAEPLYLLVDTAIVGHLGRTELAALTIATQALLTAVGLCVFLAYGTTTEVASTTDPARRAALGVQGLWLGAATGAAIALVLVLLAGPIAHLIGGGETPASELAIRYIRISAIGVAAQLVAIAGQGWLRGREQLRVALRLVVAGQVINLVAEIGLVYGLGLGLDGSALGTVLAQLAMAAATIALVSRAARATGAPLRPNLTTQRKLVRFGGLLLVRSIALTLSYLLITSLAARISDAAVDAHQIAIQLLWLGALALDALAIAAQILIASALGSDDHALARHAALRLTLISTAFGALVAALLWIAGPSLVTSIFIPDPAVADAAAELWPWLCGLTLIGGVVFALDGILIGAQDGRILALAMVGAAAVLGLTLLAVGASTLTALWGALFAMFVARVLPLAFRTLRGPLQAA